MPVGEAPKPPAATSVSISVDPIVQVGAPRTAGQLADRFGVPVRRRGAMAYLELAASGADLATRAAVRALESAGLTPDDLRRAGEDASNRRTVDIRELLNRCTQLVDRLGSELTAGADAIAKIDPTTLEVAAADRDAVAAAVHGLPVWFAARP